MTLAEMIAEWEKGCSCAGPAHDAIFHPKNPTSATECEPCTQGLIDAIKTKLPAIADIIEAATWFEKFHGRQLPPIQQRKLQKALEAVK